MVKNFTEKFGAQAFAFLSSGQILYSKFYPKRIIQKSCHDKSRKNIIQKFHPKMLSKTWRDLSYVTLYQQFLQQFDMTYLTWLFINQELIVSSLHWTLLEVQSSTTEQHQLRTTTLILDNTKSS